MAVTSEHSWAVPQNVKGDTSWSPATVLLGLYLRENIHPHKNVHSIVTHNSQKLKQLKCPQTDEENVIPEILFN